MGRIHELLVPAVNLWRAQNEPTVKEHYFEFIRLIVRSAKVWSEQQDIAAEWNVYLQKQIAAFKLDDLPDIVFV